MSHVVVAFVATAFGGAVGWLAARRIHGRSVRRAMPANQATSQSRRRTDSLPSRAALRRIHCLSRAVKTIQTRSHLDSVFRDIVAMMPFAWQCPDIACVKLCYQDMHYYSDPYDETAWRLQSDIVVHGRSTGCVQVYYMQMRPCMDEGPFLREERFLIDAIADMLALAIERNQAQNALCDSEQKFLAIFNNAVNGVCLIERFSKRCCLANDVLCDMLGYGHDEFVSLTVEDIQPGLGDQDVLDQLYDPLLGQHSLVLDVPLKRKNGSVLYTDMSSFPILVGEKEYLLDIFKDVTERHWAQHQQLQLLSRLKISNDQLNGFIDVLSQSLKAIMRGMSTLADCITSNPDSRLCSESHTHVDVLMHRIGKTNRAIDAIAYYTAIGSDDQPAKIINLEDFLDTMVDALSLPEGMSVRIVTPLPVIRLRPKLLEDVVVNLLKNAIEAMRSTGGEIQVDARETKDHWIIAVRDSGAGIEARYKESIFQIFWTSDTEKTAEHLGVGLAIAKKSVETWGGRVWVESEPGPGSTFCFTLPKELMVCESGMTIGAD